MIDKLRDRSRRCRVALGVLMIAAGAVLVVRGDPASASLSGLEVASAASAADSAASKQVTVSCPRGKVLIGAGWSVASATGRAVVTDLIPSAASVTALAHESEVGTERDWTLTVQGVCVGSLPGGVSIVSADTSTSSASPKTVTARCAGGDVALGAGFETLGLAGGASLTGLRARGGEATATVHEVGVGSPARWYVRAYAICVAARLPVRTVTDRHLVRSSATTTAVASCPRGMTAIGAGAAVDTSGPSITVSTLRVGSHLDMEYGVATGHIDEPAPGRTLSTDVRCASP